MLSRRTESSRIGLFLLDQALLAIAFGIALTAYRSLHGATPVPGLGGPGGLAAASGPEGSADALIRLYLVSAPILAIALSAAGLYRPGLEPIWPRSAGAREVLLGGFVAMLTLGFVGMVLRPDFPQAIDAPTGISRGVTWLFLPAAWLALSLSRVLLGAASRRLADDPSRDARVLVFGTSHRIEALLATLRAAPHLHLRVLGVVAPDDVPELGRAPDRAGERSPAQDGPAPSGSAGYGPAVNHAEALSLLRQGRVDHVLVESGRIPAEDLHEILALSDREGVSVHLTSALFPSTNLVPTWERIGGVPVLGFVAAELPLGARIAKRAFDVGVAGAMLVVLAPWFALLAALVRLTSAGPAFYVQRRVGAGGREFRMFKFRTMRLGAEDGTGPVFAVSNDPRCTRLGRWLRRANLDELPQLLNVLAGDMSLVGPRPERPEFVEGLKRQIPRYAHKHWVRPGITGWAQIHGLRGAGTSLHARIEHDLYYIRNWSLLLDIRILVRTVFDGYLNAA